MQCYFVCEITEGKGITSDWGRKEWKNWALPNWALNGAGDDEQTEEDDDDSDYEG